MTKETTIENQVQADETESTLPEVNVGAVAIFPTIGRKLWFFPNGASFHSTPHCIDEATPMDADVVYVWGDRMVNLAVKDHIGQVHAFNSVTLLQPGDDTPASGAYATWMPYQVSAARSA